MRSRGLFWDWALVALPRTSFDGVVPDASGWCGERAPHLGEIGSAQRERVGTPALVECTAEGPLLLLPPGGHYSSPSAVTSAMSCGRPTARLFLSSALRPITGISPRLGLKNAVPASSSVKLSPSAMASAKVMRREVLDADLKGREGRTKRCERRVHAVGVVGSCLDQDVESLRGTRVSMKRDRVTAEHDEASTRLVEFDEDISKVVEELDHELVRGTKRTGMLPRARGALAVPPRLKLSMVSRVASEMAAAPPTGAKSNSGWPSRALCMTITLARACARSRRACSSAVTSQA